jgi:hypothetical protein
MALNSVCHQIRLASGDLERGGAAVSNPRAEHARQCLGSVVPKVALARPAKRLSGTRLSMIE